MRESGCRAETNTFHSQNWGVAFAAKRSRRAAARPSALAVPFGRQGTGWEVAYAALFLISNESSYVNAHTLFLDAGHMAGIVRT
jgi:NAD(P)-dependent dehydrogenase (short-subunit alcohol dehydrogenase family)